MYIYTHTIVKVEETQRNVKETPVFPQAPVNFYDCTYVHEPPLLSRAPLMEAAS